VTADDVTPEKAEEVPAAAVDLMAALKASLEEARKRRVGPADSNKPFGIHPESTEEA
jgi:non-homologous end joining protein Ku